MTPPAAIAVAVSSAPGGDAEAAAAAPRGLAVCVLPAGRDPVAADAVAALLRSGLRDLGRLEVLVADDGACEWTRRCLERSDVVVLVGRGGGDPRLRAVELLVPPPTGRRRVELVLLHDGDDRGSSPTTAWLAERALSAHHHLRVGAAADVARVTRAMTAAWADLAGNQEGEEG